MEVSSHNPTIDPSAAPQAAHAPTTATHAVQHSHVTGVEPQKSMLTIVLIAVLSLAILGGAGWYGYSIWYPQYLVKQFFKEHMSLVRAQNFAGAYAQTTGSFQLETPAEEFERFLKSQGIANGDIPYKIVQAKPFTAPDLTKRATVLMELTGDTGATQAVYYKINRENGFYKVRLVEVPDGAGSASWIGMRYPDDMSYTSEDAMVVQQPEASPIAAEPVETQAPMQQTTRPADNDYSWDSFSSQTQMNTTSFTPVSDIGVTSTFGTAASAHFNYLMTKDYSSAVDQLHPYFKSKETPTTYLSFLQRVGIVNNADFSVTQSVVNGQAVQEVRKSGNYYIGKSEIKIRDYGTGGPETDRYIYIALVVPVPTTNVSPRWEDWQVISLFTKEYAQANPGFFPF